MAQTYQTGREAYEEDCKRYPTYHDGSKRPAWEELGQIEQWSWNRNPTPRGFPRTACEPFTNAAPYAIRRRKGTVALFDC